MGFLSSLGNALATALSIGSKISCCLSGVGLLLEGLKVLGGLFMSLGKALGVIKDDVKPEVIGDKVLQAEEAGITPEKFTSYEEYAKKVEEFKLDPEKSTKISDEAKLSKAIEFTSSLSAEKYPSFPWVNFANALITNSKFRNYLNEERIEQFGLLLKEQPSSALNVYNYLSGTELNDKKIDTAINDLKNIEKKINPEISDGEAMNNIREARLK